MSLLTGSRGLTALAACLVVTGCSSSASNPAASDPATANAGAAVPPDGPCTTSPSSGPTFLVQGTAVGLVVDDAFVYTASTSAIVRAPRAGGAAETLAQSESAVGLSSDATSLYYFGSHPVGTPDPRGKVMSGNALYALSHAGGAPRMLLDGAWALSSASDGTRIYSGAPAGVQQLAIADATSTGTTKLEPGASVQALALGKDSLFLAVQAIAIGGGASVAPVGSIRRMPLAGGAVTTVVDHLGNPTSLALDEGRVYFTDAGSSNTAAVRSARLDGTELTTIANALATSVTVDAHAVYYATADAIMKVDKASGASTTVVTGVRSPGNLTVRGGNLYWVNAASNVTLSDPNPPYGIMTACK